MVNPLVEYDCVLVAYGFNLVSCVGGEMIASSSQEDLWKLSTRQLGASFVSIAIAGGVHGEKVGGGERTNGRGHSQPYGCASWTLR